MINLVFIRTKYWILVWFNSIVVHLLLVRHFLNCVCIYLSTAGINWFLWIYYLKNCIRIIYIYIHTYMHTYIHTYIHTCKHACMHACMQMYVFIWIYVDIHIYIYMFIWIFIYIYIYIYLYMHVYRRSAYIPVSLQMCKNIPLSMRKSNWQTDGNFYSSYPRNPCMCCAIVCRCA